MKSYFTTTGCFLSQTKIKRFHNLSNSHCNNINIVLAFHSCKIGSLLNLKDLLPNGSARALFTNFHVQAVMLVILGRQPDISAHV